MKTTPIYELCLFQEKEKYSCYNQRCKSLLLKVLFNYEFYHVSKCVLIVIDFELRLEVTT